jgi:hypothetical protein
MAEIATWSAILNKTGLGKTSNECPTKAELLALNNGKNSDTDKLIVITNAASYGNNECVKLEDINAEQWIYNFKWDSDGDPSFNAPATGGTYPRGSYTSNRVKQVNGVNTTISQSLVNDATKSSEASWYTYGDKARVVPNSTVPYSRSHTVTWTQKYSGKTLTATFTQAAGKKVYSNWTYDCRLDKTSFTYNGGQANILAKRISRNYTWNGIGSTYVESHTADAISIAPLGSISGNTITIPSNTTLSSRNYTVTFIFNVEGATNQTINIFQQAGETTYVDHLSIDPTSKTSKTVAGDGQTFSVNVDANFDTYINGVYQGNTKDQYSGAAVTEGNPSDIIITRTSTGCSIKVAPNPNEGSSRTFKILFSYGSATPVYLTITQNKAVVTYPSSGYVLQQSKTTSGFSTSSLSYTATADEGTITVYLNSYRTKYVNGVAGTKERVEPSLVESGAGDWESYDITFHSGTIYKLNLNFPINNVNQQKIRRYVIYNGASYNVIGDLTQEAGVNYVFKFRDTDDLTKVVNLGDQQTQENVIYIISKQNDAEQIFSRSITQGSSWLSVGVSDGGSVGVYKVSFNVQANTSINSREARCTFTQGSSGKTLLLRVVQDGITKKWRTLKLTGFSPTRSDYYMMSDTSPVGNSQQYPILAMDDSNAAVGQGVSTITWNDNDGLPINDASKAGGTIRIHAGDTFYLGHHNHAVTNTQIIMSYSKRTLLDEDQVIEF